MRIDRPGRRNLTTLVALGLLLAPATAAGPTIEITSIEEVAADGLRRVEVAGRCDLPDGAFVHGYLKLGHDAESQLDRRPARIEDGRFALEFGPYDVPFFPCPYEVSIHFSPAEQPPGLLGGLERPPGAIEVSRPVALGDRRAAGPALAAEVARIEGLLTEIERLFDEAYLRATEIDPASLDRPALAAWIDSWREGYQTARRAAADGARRHAHAPFPRVEREIFVLFNFLIDRRYELEAWLDDRPPNPHPLGPEAFARRRAAAGRQLAFERVLLADDPAAAVERAWVDPLGRRLDAWARAAGDRMTALDEAADRVRAVEAIVRLVAEPRPAAAGAANAWCHRLATTLDELDAADPGPAVRSALGRIGRAALAGDDVGGPLATAVAGLGLATYPSDALAVATDRARRLAAELFATGRRLESADGFDQGGWDDVSVLWEAETLRLIESLGRSLPPALADRFEVPPGLAARRRSLSSVVTRLLVHKERLHAHLAAGIPFADRASDEAAILADLGG